MNPVFLNALVGATIPSGGLGVFLWFMYRDLQRGRTETKEWLAAQEKRYREDRADHIVVHDKHEAVHGKMDTEHKEISGKVAQIDGRVTTLEKDHYIIPHQ